MKTKYTRKISCTTILENYIKEKEGIISKEELFNYGISELHLKKINLSQYLFRTSNILETKDGYIHIDNIEINKDLVNQIISYTKNEVDRLSHFSIEKIFFEKEIDLKLAGIDDPKLLYSLLELFAYDDFGFNRYPKITIKEDSNTHVIDEMIEFVRVKATYVTFSELEEAFVSQRGYSKQVIQILPLKSNIYKYLQTCVIHKDTIEWNASKQANLEEIALTYYHNSYSLGNKFALISDLKEDNQLPALSNDVYWTKELICDLLQHFGNFIIIGNRKNAFVPIKNNEKIINYSDLLYFILKEHFKGATNLNGFIQYLYDIGVGSRSLTKSMITGNRIRIKDQEIFIEDLINNA